MDRIRLSLFFNTVKYLRPVQIFYLIFYKIKSFLPKKKYNTNNLSANYSLKWPVVIKKDNVLENNSFEILNLKYLFKDNPDWNFLEYGTLWNYNLNYLEFLNQKKFNKKRFTKILKNYISNKKESIFGCDPYPISLRNINILKFILNNKIKDHLIDKSIYEDYMLLYNNFEFHLQGNHLLENSLSLFLGGIYFNEKKFLKYSEKILNTELDKQILSDGAHFELSPMYHNILLERILDIIYFLKINNYRELKIYKKLIYKSKLMFNWIKEVSYSDYSYPLVNDSAIGIGLTVDKLNILMKKNSIENIDKVSVSDSGFRRINFGQFEIYINFSEIKSNFQPGHKHADFLNFELRYKSMPIIIDPGISTYEKSKQRLIERSSSMHNTIIVNNADSCQVWDSFKLGKRPTLKIIEDNSNLLSAFYKSYDSSYTHFRKFILVNNKIIIEDKVSCPKDQLIESHIHFAQPALKLDNNKLNIEDLNIEFLSYKNLKLVDYECPNGYNKLIKRKKIIGSVGESSSIKIEII